MKSDPSAIIKEARSILLNERKLKAFVGSFAQDAVKRQAAKLEDGPRRVLLQITLTNAQKNIALVFRHARSEIEKLFLNSLVIASIMRDPAFVTMTPPSSSIEKDLATFRRDLSDLKKMYTLYRRKTKRKDYIEFGKLVEATGAAPGRNAMAIAAEAMMNFEFGFANRYHCTLQPRFTEKLINESRIRADLLIWIPTHPNFKLIVECDGFKFHSSEEKFVKDRKRDRQLKSLGYDVLRFSGKEIWAQFIEASIELVNYLSDCAKALKIRT